jgi:hypothetical protein
MVARGKRFRATPGIDRIKSQAPAGRQSIVFMNDLKYVFASLQDAGLLTALTRGGDRRRSCHWLPSDRAFSALLELIFKNHKAISESL